MTKPVDEQWYHVTDALPAIGQRVRVLCVKELTYMGNVQGKTAEWKDDSLGERAIYSWTPALSTKKVSQK